MQVRDVQIGCLDSEILRATAPENEPMMQGSFKYTGGVYHKFTIIFG